MSLTLGEHINWIKPRRMFVGTKRTARSPRTARDYITGSACRPLPSPVHAAIEGLITIWSNMLINVGCNTKRRLGQNYFFFYLLFSFLLLPVPALSVHQPALPLGIYNYCDLRWSLPPESRQSLYHDQPWQDCILVTTEVRGSLYCTQRPHLDWQQHLSTNTSMELSVGLLQVSTKSRSCQTSNIKQSTLKSPLNTHISLSMKESSNESFLKVSSLLSSVRHEMCIIIYP